MENAITKFQAGFSTSIEASSPQLRAREGLHSVTQEKEVQVCADRQPLTSVPSFKTYGAGHPDSGSMAVNLTGLWWALPASYYPTSQHIPTGSHFPILPSTSSVPCPFPPVLVFRPHHTSPSQLLELFIPIGA